MPMMNMFGIEFTGPINAGSNDYFNTAGYSPLSLSEPMWFGKDNNPSTPSVLGEYYLPKPGRCPVSRRYYACPAIRSNMDWQITRADVSATGFPEGNFAYIPLDPVQTDPTAPDFMRYVKHYWIVMYGSTDSAQRNKYKNVFRASRVRSVPEPDTPIRRISAGRSRPAQIKQPRTNSWSKRRLTERMTF